MTTRLGLAFLLLASSLLPPFAAAARDCVQADTLIAEAERIASSNPAQAEQKLSRALELCEDSGAVRYNLALARHAQGQAQEAKATLEENLRQHPAHAASLNALAFLLLSEPNGDYAAAQRLAKRAVELEPANRNFRDTLLSVSVDVPPKTGASNPNAVAVVIGNRNYKHKDIPEVEFAHRDATAVREYLVNTLGYSPGNVVFLTDASLNEFNQVFGTEGRPKAKLFNYVKAGASDVFVYYVGHGAPDLQTQNAYFVPSDADPSYLEQGGYPLAQLWENLGKVPAKSVTVVLDTCFAGNSEKGTLIRRAMPLILSPKASFDGPQGSVVMTSGAADQVSSTLPEKRHSLFTYYWLKGLAGDADADMSGSVTLGELKYYIQENVVYSARRMGREQTPIVRGDDSRILAQVR